MSDSLEGYTVAGHMTSDDSVWMDCDRCGDLIADGDHVSLAALVRAATEHSGECVG